MKQLAVGIVLACLLLSGCASTASPAPNDGAKVISAEQEAELADGVVTYDEYHAAFERFRACLTDAGFELMLLPEQYDIIQYGVPVAASDAGVDIPCYVREYQSVDGEWQTAHQDTSETAEIYRNCLVANGITPKETFLEMVAQLDEEGIARDSCITD